ncbi:MHS family MFS transporter [Amycolatopsis acidicola]|uniref:Putative proline/betaine transporter n=1 Tax=Amycolatopsis acidicola TaxID=2596893 RepID=A0A5N0V5S1_9PSEU|nr:MFS transporter [Amycolatopsis acidicola]KAA9161335.1 MHS family MFS transporter [Amycolatopsis acidicola]
MPEAVSTENDGGAQPVDRAAARRVAIASALGTTVEYYDFTLYATTAALVFNKIFFPSVSSAVGALASFSTFFVGYLARPLGGVLFGHFGDRLGRKAMLVTTLLIMGLGTVLIGVLPSYGSIGIAAPILLVVIRLLQGVGMGGEYGGGVLMAMEFAPRNRQGFYTSLVHIGTPAGVLIPVGVVSILDTVMTDAQFESWGWRIPFLLSAVLIAVGLYLRLKISESPEFRRFRAEADSHKVPVAAVAKHHLRDVLASIVAKIAESGLFNVYYVVALSYATTQLHMAKTPVLLGILIACALECLTLPYFGRLSDRIGRRRLYIAGALFQLVLAVPFFLLMDTRNPVLITVAMSLGLAVGHGAMYGAQAALFANLYPVDVRYTGLSITQQFGATLGGGLSPLLGSALIVAGGGSWGWVVVYMIAVAVVSSLCTVPLRRGEITTTPKVTTTTGAAR